ncbi:MAG TPA: hypothetical protein VHG71_09525 [Verrucomicrobiae bacterium]|nr:hypothetical protein [Verrucomicrobiae bacterium]
MTNSAAALAAAKTKLAITAAYKFVALAVMLTNCNLFIEQTELPVKQPPTLTNISKIFVAPPKMKGFGGSVVYSNYFFGFVNSYLANFANVDIRRETREKQIEWAKISSQIDTNQVHTLAVTWLNNLGVDTLKLDQDYPYKISQRFYYKNTGGQIKTMDSIKALLPIFDISWGSIPMQGHPEYTSPAVSMTIFGPTKELAEYHLMDNSLMKKPKLDLINTEKLLQIPDSEFRKYTPAQKDELVKKYGF